MKEKKQLKYFITSIGAVSMAAVLAAAPESMIFAASPELVDSSRTGSISIHKYDITTAESKGAYTQGTYAATGEADLRVENALKGYEIQGVEFSYLKVGDVETYESSGASGTEVVLVYELPEKLVQILGLSEADAIDMSAAENSCTNSGVYHYTSTQVSGAMAEILKNDNIAAKNQLEKYLASSGSAVTMPETDASGVTSAAGLSLGLYLLAETAVPEDVTSTVDPWLVQLPFTDSDGDEWVYDMTCYPKNQTGNPTIDKSVRSEDDTEEGKYGNTATASEGDTLDYILVSKMPHITSQATYITEYTFSDTLSRGLTYNKDVTVYFYHTQEDADCNNIAQADEVWKQGDGLFTDTYTQKKDGNSSLTVKMTDSGLEKLNMKSDAYIVVSYTAELNSDAEVVLGDEGNPNDVQLTWKRTSDSYYDTLEDRNYVYAYGLNLTKTFSDDKGSFRNVKFNMYNSTDEYYVVAEQVSEGIYNVTGKAADQSDATTFIPNATSGKIVIEGLEADEYQVTETATDAGYKLLTDSIDVVITPTDRDIIESEITGGRTIDKTDMYVGPIKCATATVDGNAQQMTASGDSANAVVSMTVINTPGFKLPQTGGAGTFALPIVGVIVAFGGVVVVMKSRKKAA